MRYYKLSFVIFLIPFFVFGKTNFYGNNTLDLLIGFSKTSGSSFYDLKGDIISELNLPNSEDETQKYRFNYFEYNYEFNVNYHLNDRIFFNFYLPLKYYTLTEETDTVYFGEDNSQYTQKIKIGDYSLFQHEFFQLGVNYILYRKDSNFIATNIDFLIPPGFHNGLYDDPDYNFLSDGAFQVNIGLMLLKEFKKGWIESKLEYRYKTEDFKDDIKIYTEAGLSTVPGTALSVSLEFIQSLGNFNYARAFTPKETPSQFNSFSVGFNFLIFFDEQIYSNFSYQVNLLGKNIWNIGGYNIQFGVKL